MEDGFWKPRRHLGRQWPGLYAAGDEGRQAEIACLAEPKAPIANTQGGPSCSCASNSVAQDVAESILGNLVKLR